MAIQPTLIAKDLDLLDHRPSRRLRRGQGAFVRELAQLRLVHRRRQVAHREPELGDDKIGIAQLLLLLRPRLLTLEPLGGRQVLRAFLLGLH